MESTAVVTAAVAALAALGGVLLQHLLTQRSRQHEDRRRTAVERADRTRQYRLREVEATRRRLVYDGVRLMRWVVGAAPLPNSPKDMDMARYQLIGDAELYRQIGRLHAALQARKPPALPAPEEVKELQQAQDRALELLRVQALRILADEDVIEVPRQVVIDAIEYEANGIDAFMATAEEIVADRNEDFARRMASALAAELAKRSTRARASEGREPSPATTETH